MADREQDEYQNVKFYAEHSKAKNAGFSKFKVGEDFYFCRYIDGDIAMLSQAYVSEAGRDNGIESVKKNEKIAKRFKFESRGTNQHGFALKAGNGQEIAISPDYASLGRAQHISARLSGNAKASTSSSTASKKKTSAKPKVKKTATKTASASSGQRMDDYKRLAFYQKHGGNSDGFNSFEKDGAYYFHYNEAGKIILISEGYTSKRGRDNGIASVSKNMNLRTAYQHRRHKNGKYFFNLIAGNRQEIATSRWFDSKGAALNSEASLRGERTRTRTAPAKVAVKKTAPRKAAVKPKAKTTKVVKAAKSRKVAAPKPRSGSGEQNYMPLAAYRKATKGKNRGFETFQGEDGEYYFTYFENGKIALISEGYPSAVIRATGQASVEKNMKIEKRYVFGKGADGKEGFILRAGNHKEIARSVGYGSAAAAAAGAAYLMGTRRRVKPKPAPVKTAKAKPAVKRKTVRKKAKPVATLAKGSVAAAGLGAAAAAKPKPKPKPKPIKKAAVPVKAAKPKPPAKPKPVKKKVKPVAPLAAGGVAIAGLGAAAAAAAKSKPVKKAAIPVKAAPIKKPAPVKAAPVAAAAAVTTAAAVAATPKPPVAPKPEPVVAAKPVVAAAAKPAAAAAAIPAAAGGGGIWGWLKWLLLALLALLAMLFLFKSCAGGGKDIKTTPPIASTNQTAAPAIMVTCWNGSKAKSDEACPAKITCWDNSFATQESACPAKPVAKDVKCWDGSMAIDLAGCPAEPAKTPAATIIATPAPSVAVANTARLCAPSSNTLFNVTSSRPKSVSYLGSNPQFGNSLSLTPDGFYRKLATAHRSYANDRAFLNSLARSLGYGSFDDMDASMFSNDTLPYGTSGLLGFSSQHALQFSSLDVSDSTHLEAFKVRAANGNDVHFMKRCGNYMYVCQP